MSPLFIALAPPRLYRRDRGGQRRRLTGSRRSLRLRAIISAWSAGLEEEGARDEEGERGSAEGEASGGGGERLPEGEDADEEGDEDGGEGGEDDDADSASGAKPPGLDHEACPRQRHAAKRQPVRASTRNLVGYLYRVSAHAEEEGQRGRG